MHHYVAHGPSSLLLIEHKSRGGRHYEKIKTERMQRNDINKRLLQLDASWASAPTHGERVVQDSNLRDLNPSEAKALLEFMRETTAAGMHHKVLVNVRSGWVLTASVDDARKLIEFVASLMSLRRSTRTHNPYGPITPDVQRLFFRPAPEHVGPRISWHACRCSRDAHKVAVRVEVEHGDLQEQIRLIRCYLATLVARACGVTHDGWLNANTAIELVDVPHDEPLIMFPAEVGHEEDAAMPRLRLVSVAVILDSKETASRFISFFECGHETRG